MAITDRLGQSLAGQVHFQLFFAHQSQRLAQGDRLRAQERFEVARDDFAVAHQQAGGALAQAEQAGQVLALGLIVVELQLELQLLLDRPVQRTGDRAELLDGDALEFFEQAYRVRAGCVCHAERLDGQGTPRVSAGAPDRYEARA